MCLNCLNRCIKGNTDVIIKKNQAVQSIGKILVMLNQYLQQIFAHSCLTFADHRNVKVDGAILAAVHRRRCQPIRQQVGDLFC